MKLLAYFLAARFHELLGELVDDDLVLARVLVGLHVGLRNVLALACTVHAHGRLRLRHGHGRDLHGPLELSVGEGRVELLWSALPHALGTKLDHHVHLARIHAVHRIAYVSKVALHTLQVLLACVGHGDQLLLDLLDILVFGLGLHKVLRLELERRAHGVQLRHVGLEQAELGEELERELATLLGRDTLLPALGDLSLLELLAVVLDEMLEAGVASSSHASLLHVWVVHGDGEV